MLSSCESNVEYAIRAQRKENKVKEIKGRILLHKSETCRLQ